MTQDTDPTDPTDRASAARKVLDVLEALTGFACTGARNMDLAHATRLTATQVTRAMDELIAKGWARKNEDSGVFFPAAGFVNMTFRVMADFDKAAQRLEDRRRAMTQI